MCEIRENAMQKKQFQQNMKDKVRVFEDGGIRLLKRGQKGVVHAIFSRFGLVLVLLLLQAFALFSLLQWFGGLLPHYFGGTLLVTAAMMVYLLNQDMDNSVRITWLVVTALMPVLGVPLFWYTKSDVGHNALKHRLLDLEGQTGARLPQNEQTVELLQEQAERSYCGSMFSLILQHMERGEPLQDSWILSARSIPWTQAADTLCALELSGDGQRLGENLRACADSLHAVLRCRQADKQQRQKMALAITASCCGLLVILLL